ncbi:MAG: DJ-1/PfpI family protein [Lachnospiraceae bacterium]|nr:DJ-1/PfpI family protein [Lachnospiraceae bacterium]
MKAYIFLADGFEEVEALTTADILIRAGVEVKLVKIPGGTEDSTHKCKAVRGSHNIKVKPDLTLNMDTTEEELMDAECVILPGGMPGTVNLASNSAVVNIIKEYDKAGKVVAAICAAPSILGENNLLVGKKATCFPGNEPKLKGAELVKEGAVIDGNIVTGKSMGSAVTFGLKVVERLLGKEASEKVESSIYRG